MTSETNDRLVMRPELAEKLGNDKPLCSETIRRWLKSGKLPKPDVALSKKTTGWRLSTLQAAGINLV